MATISSSRLKKLAKASIGPRSQARATRLKIDTRESWSAVAKLMTKTIPDLPALSKQFDAVSKKHMAKAQSALKKARADAIKHSRSTKSAAAAMIAARLKAYEAQIDAAPPNVPSPEYHLLNTPFEISSTPGLPLSGSEIVPSNSWAKFKLQVGEDKNLQLAASFYYVWVNPLDKYVVMNVDGYMIFRGHCNAGVDGGFFPGDRYLRLRIDARLDIFDWTNEPIPFPYAPYDQAQNVFTIDEDQGGWSTVGAVYAQDIFRGYDLRHPLLLVPPGATIGFAMTAAIDCETGDDDGSADIDFASGDFQVGSPAVLLAIVS